MRYSVLFVCTANICRSPMVEGLMHAKVQKAGDGDKWLVQSAGVWADSGYPAAVNTLNVLAARGIDLRSHRSQPITVELVDSFNLILVMERNHKEALRAAFPKYSNKIYMLSEMVDMESDVVDPIGGSTADFEETARELEEILEQGFLKIMQFSEDNRSHNE